MTNNEKLARWQGKCYHVSDWGQTTCKYCGRTNDPRYFDFDTINPDYLNDDAAAMSLLDTLVEKGYAVAIASRSHKWDIGIARNDCNLDYCISTVKPTRCEAVVVACLGLIEREASNANS